MTQWKVGRREREGGRVKLSRRCYQVKPPTTDCRHGDTMVTTRCSSREDLPCVKGLPQSVSSSLFLSVSVTLVGLFVCLFLTKGFMYMYIKNNHTAIVTSLNFPASQSLTYCKFLLYDLYLVLFVI